MSIKINRMCTRTGCPVVHVTAEADEIADLRSKLVPNGPKGSLNKKSNGRLFIVSGYRAIEVITLLGEPLGEYAAWVADCPRPVQYLPDSVFLDEAKKYTYKQEWKKKSSWSYQQVLRKRKHLIPECTAHMQAPLGPVLRGYQIYAYEFPDNHVYVGLTCNPTVRHYNHTKQGTVFNYSRRKGLAPLFIVVTDGLSATDAARAEQQAVECYESNGWQLLNSAHGGSLGQLRGFKYTYEAILEMARPFQHRKQFQKAHYGPYQFASKHKWMQRIADELKWPSHVGHKWNYDTCLASARRYDYQADWVAAEAGAFLWAVRSGNLAQIKQAAFTRGRKITRKWTPETCAARAREFKSRADWQYNCHDGSWGAASKKKWLAAIGDEVFGPRLRRCGNCLHDSTKLVS